MSRCPDCGKMMWEPGIRRRFVLWLRPRVERLLFRLDMATAPRFNADTWPHIHATDEEWAAFEGAIAETPE